MKKNKSGKITIDQLAGMVQKGFGEVTTKMATKSEMSLGFKKVNIRLGRIEGSLIKKHSDEIKYIKERLVKLEEALAIE